MSDPITTVRSQLSSAFSRLVSWASRLTPARLAWGGLALAAVTLLSVNLIGSVLLGSWKADLTEEKLYTISPGSVSVLRAMDEPVKARLYFSRKLGELAPSYAQYFDRLRTLLEEFQNISGNKLELEILDPEPFSDAEDRAVAAGISGRRLNAEGEMGYFGLAASNSTDDQDIIPFLSPDRESYIEYDITKLIHGLSHPKKRVVGILSSLPLDGGMNPMTKQPSEPWLVMSQIREFFDVETLDQAMLREIPSKIDVLLIAQPTLLTPESAYAVEQYALKGGKLLVMIDPMVETAQFEVMEKKGEGRAELAKLLKNWGIDFDPKQAATDIRNARRVQFGREGGGVTEFVAWLTLGKEAIDQRDVLSSGIEILNLASAGVLKPTGAASPTVTPILSTSSEAMIVPTDRVGMTSDPIALLRSYAPGGKPLMLAARISGEAKTAFADGIPRPDDSKTAAGAAAPADGAKKDDTSKAEAPKSDKLPLPAGHVASGTINAIVVADTDLLNDRFWVETRQMMGQQVAVPHAHNAAFVVGALENLTGSDDLIALRGRGIKERTFTLVEDLRRDAERKFREKEQALTERLKGLEDELSKLQTASAAGNAIVSEQENAAVESFKTQMLETRRELRQVKLALRQNIDSLDGWLKFANIALVPLLIAVGGVGWTFWRSRRRTAPRS